MNYITVSEAAEKWGVSKSLVRRYLAQNRFEAQVELQKLAARRGTMMPDMYEEDDV